MSHVPCWWAPHAVTQTLGSRRKQESCVGALHPLLHHWVSGGDWA